MQPLTVDKRPTVFIVIALLAIMTACIPGTAAPVTDTPPPTVDQDVGLANPASVHCEEQGGRVEMREDAEGNQSGVCIFEDGSECEEWALYRGECEMGQMETPAGDDVPGLTEELVGTDWDLIEMVGELLIPGSTITISFDKSSFRGSAGCNSYFGDFTASGSQLNVGMVGNTEMWCEGLMDQEQAYLSRLVAAVSLTYDDRRLTIHSSAGDLIFESAKHQALEGVNWILSGIAQGDGVVQTWIDAEITASFLDGQVTGTSGCNQYFTAYEADGTALALGPIGGTKMACDEERNQREADFLAAMAAVTGFRIHRDTLVLTDGDGSERLMFRAQSEPTISEELLGRVWHWHQFEDSAGINDIQVDDPSKYTLELRPDGTNQIQADCNQGGGSYKLDGTSLSLLPGPMTLAACGSDSLDTVFLSRLADVVTFVFDDGTLLLNLKMDAGNMVFVPEAG